MDDGDDQGTTVKSTVLSLSTHTLLASRNGGKLDYDEVKCFGADYKSFLLNKCEKSILVLRNVEPGKTGEYLCMDGEILLNTTRSFFDLIARKLPAYDYLVDSFVAFRESHCASEGQFDLTIECTAESTMNKKTFM